MRRDAANRAPARLTSAGIAAAIIMLAPAARADTRQKSDEERVGRSADRASGEEQGKDRIEHFRIGPLVGVGFPRPLAIGGLAKFERLVGAGFEYSFLPRMNVRGVDAGFNALAVDLRVFPFKGAFFIGARAGRQWLDAKATVSAGRFGSFTESMDASTWFLNPRAGILHTFESGITMGIDAGVQLPISPSYRRSGLATEAGLASQLEIDGTLVAVAGALGNNATPTIDLFRLGFLF